MNVIQKHAIGSLGYQFVDSKYIPKGSDEYYLRNIQNRSGINYRHLTAFEIEVLIRNRNTSDNWNLILVSDAFNPELVKNCKFFGLVRIGKLEPYFLEFHNLKLPVGLYNSTIISCDFGDNVVVENVNYMSHYIVGNDAILVNINELAVTDHAKFGNGILKEDEPESIRIWLEVCNENGGRKIVPFNGMLPGDAWLWSRYRDNSILQNKFLELTEHLFDKKRGYYGKIGDRTVIKNTRIIKDAWIGSDAYIKGANKIKNVTINSSFEAKSQIGEGCELVNGVVGLGCRIFYGVKAVRFFMASHSQLKYGARLINSYLGNNATISCCEVLNSLIFPAHEQHHNNSFLCAALVMGQSNIAAGATIGSNHNSRAADGELIAGRGFWPGLCVSLKHNSVFASFAIIAKGDYPAELNIPIPFALISDDITHNRLVIMPAYWFMYNMYALARNAWKSNDRDKRMDKTQHIETNFLAPDSIYEIVHAIESFKICTGKAFYLKEGKIKVAKEQMIQKGTELLEAKDPIIPTLEILAEGFENSMRKVVMLKITESYHIFKELVAYYCSSQIIKAIESNGFKNADALKEIMPARPAFNTWQNVGGQLIPGPELSKMLGKIETGKIKTWDTVHQFYLQQAAIYPQQQLSFAIAAFHAVYGIWLKKADTTILKNLLLQSIATKKWMVNNIAASRAKDYTNPFRKMVYANEKEMAVVTGDIKKNSFILQEMENLKLFEQTTLAIIKKFKL